MYKYLPIILFILLIGCISKNNIDAAKYMKFNGVYYCEEADYTNYFRFYNNGAVIALTNIEKYNEKILENWSREYYDDITGNYAIENNSIKFSTHSGNDTIEYAGIINDNSIVLNSHSNINGKDENNKMYMFREFGK
jgi:hypothetical protein